MNARNYFSTVASKMGQIEADRASWREALAPTDFFARQVRDLSQMSLASEQISKAMKALHSPAITIAQQYQDQLSANSSAMKAVMAWQDAERIQSDQMRRMIDHMDAIRKSILASNATQKFVREFTAASSIEDHMMKLANQYSGISTYAETLALKAHQSREQSRRLLDIVKRSNSIQTYLNEFETVNKQWKVPNEVLGLVGSFKEIQEQLGRVALPTIDWGSAGALAHLLGQEGIEEQLTLVGIMPDGTMHMPCEMQERGIFSRQRPDPLSLVSLLLTILIFIYQEVSNLQELARAEAFQAQTTARLQVQSQQILNLTVLIEQALTQAAHRPEERFVVRERTATVRTEPEHGASVEAKLLPNEVMRSVDRKGRWVEVEYYHWLHEQYRTGWVLKHYLERVPSSYSTNDEE